MVRRKKKNSSVGLYITSIIIILGIIGLYFSGILKIKTTPTNNHSSTGNIVATKSGENNPNKFYTDNIISGNLIIQEIPYNISVGTNYQTTFKGKEMYLRSDKYDLSAYKNKDIKIKGKIIGFSSDNLPVLDITNILKKGKNNNTENTTGDNQPKIKKNKYYSDNGIIINFQNTNLKVKDLSGNITIYKESTGNLLNEENLSGNTTTGDITTGNNIITTNIAKISYFKCQKGSSLYDCGKLKKQYKMYKFTTIVNNNGVKFYKLPETNEYSILGANYGYNLTPLSGNVYKYINNISLINTKKLETELIKNTCRNNNYNLSTILNISNSGDNYTVDGFGNKSNKLICKLTINGTNNLIGKLQSLKITQKEIKSNKIDESKYLAYKSRAFSYTLYMPKSIKYEADILKGNFGISGLDCRQVVKIADWKTGKLSSPNVEVYYCKTNLSKSVLNKFLKLSQLSYIIKQVNGKTFIIKYKPGIIGEKIVSNIKIF